MKALINSLKRTHGFKALAAFLVCLSFLILPYCQKDELNQGSIPDIDGLSFSALSKKDNISYGKVKDIEGNVYKTVKIGKQWWMAENLKTTKYNDGTDISNVIETTEWAVFTSGAYCWHNNDISNKAIYGALYNWYAVGTGKLCPTGWHVPTDAEWTILTTYLGGESVAGGKLKETGTYHWKSPNTGATNETGFTALPCGIRNWDGAFFEIDTYGEWWSSTEQSASDVYYRFIRWDAATVYRSSYNKTSGFPIRCLKGN